MPCSSACSAGCCGTSPDPGPCERHSSLRRGDGRLELVLLEELLAGLGLPDAGGGRVDGAEICPEAAVLDDDVDPGLVVRRVQSGGLLRLDVGQRDRARDLRSGLARPKADAPARPTTGVARCVIEHCALALARAERRDRVATDRRRAAAD